MSAKSIVSFPLSSIFNFPVQLGLKNQQKFTLIPDYKRPGLLCLALLPHQKSGLTLVKKGFLKLKIPKNHCDKKCAPQFLFFNEKINSWMILALHDEAAKLCKASLDAYNRGGWLIFKDLLKNWVAEGVSFEVNDFNADSRVFTITMYKRIQSKATMLR